MLEAGFQTNSGPSNAGLGFCRAAEEEVTSTCPRLSQVSFLTPSWGGLAYLNSCSPGPGEQKINRGPKWLGRREG